MNYVTCNIWYIVHVIFSASFYILYSTLMLNTLMKFIFFGNNMQYSVQWYIINSLQYDTSDHQNYSTIKLEQKPEITILHFTKSNNY